MSVICALSELSENHCQRFISNLASAKGPQVGSSSLSFQPRSLSGARLLWLRLWPELCLSQPGRQAGRQAGREERPGFH